MATRRLRRFSIGGFAIAIAIGAAAVVSSPASADAIDPGRPGSIAIHRFETPPVPTGLPSDGTPVDTTGLVPVEGVEYVIRRVAGIDLATSAGWALAQSASIAFDPGDPNGSLLAVPGVTGLGSPLVVVTDADGTAESGPLPVGLYLVTEGALPPGAQPAAPVVVSVPLTDPDSGDWRYEVHIYPKSAVFGVGKTVDDLDLAAVGEEVEYTITTDIPIDPPIDDYRIRDALDTRLALVDASVSISDGSAVVDGVDYLVDVDAANVLTVDFTAAGRSALLAAAGEQVEVLLTATVEGTGTIENQAALDLDAGLLSGSFLSLVAETRLGGLTVRKVDETGAALAGAEFAVYRSEADALADDDRIALGGQTSFTTAGSGEVELDGLRFSDFAGGAAVGPGDPGYHSYWLGEVAAPPGFRPLGAPIEFEVTAATSAGTVVLEVENLPLTRSAGPPDLAFTGLAVGGAVIGGSLLIGGGLGFAVLPALRRRQGMRAPR